MRRLTIALAVITAGASFVAAADARPLARHRHRVARVADAQPDQVIQWNRTLLTVLQTPGAQPATIHPTRSMAITQLAVYDAVNAIQRGGRSYLFLHAPRHASTDAAAAAAADTAMLALFPSQKSVIDATFQGSLSQLGDGERIRQGIRVGHNSGRRPRRP
jgi:hypothetical protein